MEDLIDIHKAFLGAGKPLLRRTTARQVASTPHGVTWQTEVTPGLAGRIRGEKPMVGGLNRFTTGHNPKAWELEQGVRQGVRQSKVSAAKRTGKRLRPISSTAALPQAPSTYTPEWLR